MNKNEYKRKLNNLYFIVRIFHLLEPIKTENQIGKPPIKFFLSLLCSLLLWWNYLAVFDSYFSYLSKARAFQGITCICFSKLNRQLCKNDGLLFLFTISFLLGGCLFHMCFIQIYTCSYVKAYINTIYILPSSKIR